MKKILSSLEQIANKTSKLCRKINHPKKVAFMHIPKCAGSSVMSSLRKNDTTSWAGHIDGPETRVTYAHYMANQPPKWNLEFERELYKLRQVLLINKFKKRYPIISGHVPFIHTLKETYPEYYFFTIIRSPISRFLSAFNYEIAQQKTGDTYLKLIENKGIDYAFDQYLDSERAILEGNLLSIFLSECGKQELDFKVIEEKAFRGINYFDFIGTTENIGLVTEELQKQKLIVSNIENKNVTNKKQNTTAIKTQDNLQESQKNKVKELCKIDEKLYNYLADENI